MAIQIINAQAVRSCFLAAAENLSANQEIINELNVFPVPDGDTGTNMTMTIQSAAREVAALGDDCTMADVCRAISMGSLRGARGNSGVILSQLLRGFAKTAAEYEELTPNVVAVAFEKGTETAYKAVMKPKEGTILTVAHGISAKAAELVKTKHLSVQDFADEILHHAEYVLSQTPEMLPVLKEAGVVDSGGRGLVEVIRGAADLLNGRRSEVKEAPEAAPKVKLDASGINEEVVASADIKFGYCTEFILEADKPFNANDEANLKRFLESIGDSIVCVAMDEIVKVHVHTNHPGSVFEEALKYGALTSVKVDNMRKEHNERLFKLQNGTYEELSKENEAQAEPEAEKAEAEHKAYGFVAVSAGDGLSEVFEQLGVDYVISGGQTMNPSTEDILKAVEAINADTVFVLPNNKNIVLAANQAAELVENKKVIVIPSKTVPQGIAAMISFIGENSVEENEEAMKEALGTVKTGEITYAVRDTEIDGKKIASGDFIGIDDDGIAAVGQSIDSTALELIAAMADEDSEVIGVYYGSELDEKSANALAAKIEAKYPDVEVDVTAGGQPVYYYIISVE
ncbi:MAG: DAK2 domain-containing protein [Lachnospiraceae bacterium]|nr:DAK2 domain-containing protein [Lachnospiraceae bacterium]